VGSISDEAVNFFQSIKHDQCIRLTTSLPSVSRFSGKCRILDVSQPHRPPWSVTGIALLFLLLPHLLSLGGEGGICVSVS
jgi:hypothetical protein